MATKQQIPALAGSILSKQEGFSVLSSDDAQWAIENTEEAIRLACEAIRTRNNAEVPATPATPAPPKRSIPSSMTEQLGMWRELYAHYFGLTEPDSFNPTLPAEAEGFGWLVAVQKGITIEAVVKALKTRMKVYRYTDSDLDKAVPTNERTADRDYATTIRDQVEPDDNLRNTSAAQVAKKKLLTMTLFERLLLELFYFHFTGEHLDIKGVTICAGSRCSDGGVPCVFWNPDDDRLDIGWCGTDYSSDGGAARAVQVAG